MEAKEEEENQQEGGNQQALSTPGPSKDPVNVETPGWKSSQGDQGSGVFGTGGDKPTVAEEKEEEKDASGTGTGVGGEVAPVGGRVQQQIHQYLFYI